MKKAKKVKRERVLLTAMILLLLAIVIVLCVAFLGKNHGGGSLFERPLADGEYALEEDDPLAIRSVVVGDTQAEAVKVVKDGESSYLIKVTMTADFPFEKTTLNLELADGAGISDESNCILTDLGGRLVVNLTVENACIVVENGEETREYRFQIELK